MLTAIYGGTFNPVHRGHTQAALTAAKALQVDTVRMMLSARPSHRDDVCAGVAHRWRMLELACALYPELTPDDTEMKQPTPSFTVVTLQQLHRSHPGIVPCWILGHDAFQLLNEWFEWDTLTDFANLVVLRRAGVPVDLCREMQTFVERFAVDTLAPDRVGQLLWLDASLPDISSTQIRNRIRCGAPVEHLLEAPVCTYIRAHNLYRETAH